MADPAGMSRFKARLRVNSLETLQYHVLRLKAETRCSKDPTLHQSSSYLMSIAAEFGRIHILEFLLLECGLLLYDNAYCLCAACFGQVEALHWLIVKGFQWDVRDTSIAAADHGHVNILVYLAEFHTLLVDQHHFAAAAFRGCIAVMEWLYARRCHMDSHVFLSAVRGGRLEAVQWLHDHNCPWDNRAYDHASRMARTKIAEFLVANNCV